MAAIIVKAFNGMKPIVDPVLLQGSDAQVANNVLLTSGAMRPMNIPTMLKGLKKFAPKTIYRFDPDNVLTEADHWFEFDKDTDVMRSPIAQDQFDRVYWTDFPDEARYAPASMALTPAGDGSLPGAGYILGVPKPTTAPTVTDFSAPEIITTVGRTYCMTFWDGTKESPPGSSWTVQAVDGKEVKLTNLTTDNKGNSAVTDKRLYRKVPDPSPATTQTYRRIATIPLDTTEYTDSTTDAAAAALPTLPLSDAPRGPQYPPTASAVPLKTGTATVNPIKREYVYLMANGVSGGVPYQRSKTSLPVSIMADDSQTVHLAGLTNVGTEAASFQVYRRDGSGATFLYLRDQPVNITTLDDAVGPSGAVLGSSLPLAASDGPTTPPAPTLTVNTSTAAGAVKRVYMLTYIDSSGKESPRSPESEIVEVLDGETEVTLIHSEPLPPGVTKKRLYRQDIVVTGGIINVVDANWLFVAENTASGTTAVDLVKTADLPGGGYSSGLQNLPPSPSGAPTSKADIPPSVVPESRVYCYTYVTAYDEEGPPSPSSEVVSVDPAKPVTVGVPGGPPTGAYNITKKRIYRSATGTQRTKFQFVGECPVATTSFVDDVRTAALSELLITEGWIPPPKGLQGLRLMANGAAVGFVGNSLYFSEPNLPHAWPHEYPIDAQIVGIGVFGQSVAVLTNGFPYLFSGIDPSAMASSKMQLPQACVNKRSIVETGEGVLYAAPDGLTMIGQGATLVTQAVLGREQWTAYNPPSMEGFVYNGKIILTYEVGGVRGMLLFDLSGAGAFVSTSDVNQTVGFSGGYYEPNFDTLYFAQGQDLMRFDHGIPLPARWRSKVFRLPQEDNFGFAKVVCDRYDSYPKFTVYSDGFLVYEKFVTSAEQFRLPSGWTSLDWEFMIEGDMKFTEVCITSSSAELQAT